MTLTETEYALLIEALAARASRLESYGRSNPRSAGPHDRKAEAMRALREKLLQMKSGDYRAPSTTHDWDVMTHKPGDRGPGMSDW